MHIYHKSGIGETTFEFIKKIFKKKLENRKEKTKNLKKTKKN